MIILGLDPGLSGAVAFYNPEKDIIDIVDTPTMGDKKQRSISAAVLASEIKERTSIHMPWVSAYVEDVHAMIGWGVGSSFRFGESKGVLFGVLATLRIPTYRVSPQKWKKAMGLGRDKDASRKMAIERFPAFADLFARVMDDNRAEAALIAYYGSQQVSKPRNSS
jgi:crossover junction endodeoxyribonuclease RuvC